MFSTQEKLAAYTGELWEHRCQSALELFPMAALEAGSSTDEIVFCHPGKLSGAQSAQKGCFFTGRDHYLWLQTQVQMPAARDGFQIVGCFDFGKTGDGFNSGFESLLYIDGMPHQGVDTFHNEVVLDAFAGKSIELTFLLWTGLEGGGMHKEHMHCLRKAEISYLHADTDRLFYLADAIVHSAPLLAEADPQRQTLLDMLDESFRLLDWDSDCLQASASPALACLTQHLAACPKHSGVTVHCVGHTHIDVAWLWRLKHTREKAIRSFSTALRLMEQNDDFLFLQSQPQLYQYMKQDCPALYAQIKQRVAEGRWEADGGMWLEADCNITSGEALVRQFLHGCTFIKQEFGRDCTHLWLPDVFGYSWALPQILKQCGIKTFATSKISWNDTNRMPHDLFRWRGIDGSEILTYFITTPYAQTEQRYGSTYNGMLTAHEAVGCWERFQDKSLSTDVLIPFGYGDGGGGVTTDMLKRRRALEALPGVPHVVNDTAGGFFETLHHNMEQTRSFQPVWDGELYLEYHRGTYTSQAKNKQWNRKLELALAQTEWLASCAVLAGHAYPHAALHGVWETVLRNQFHDIIPGSSIREVYEDSSAEYTQADAQLTACRDALLPALVHSSENDWTLWNFTGAPREDLSWIPEPRAGRFETLGGEPLPACRDANGYRVRVPLEGLHLRTIRFVPDAAPCADDALIRVDTGAAHTPFYDILWDANGCLTSVYDKEYDREVLNGHGNRLEIYEDKPLRYDAWDIDLFHLQKRETAALTQAPQLVEHNALRAVVRFSYQYRKSTITQDMVLSTSSRRIDFVTNVAWREKHRLLKAAFELAVRTTKASYDIQFGHVERPTHFNTSWDWARFEVVGHKWADLSDSTYGAAVLNDCKYGYSALDSTLRLSLLKSATFPDPEADSGEHAFTYSLLPHTGTAAQSDVIAESLRLNIPTLAAKGTAVHTKRLLWLDNPCVLVDAIKQAEDANGLILRFHEATGSRQRVTVKSDYSIRAVQRCNLLETPEGDAQSGEPLLTLAPFELCTLRLQLSQLDFSWECPAALA